MPTTRKRHWFQFSLRTLLAASVLISVLLGWWFRPFVIETHRRDGSLRRQFTVRRDWRGSLVSHGKQHWVLHDRTRFEMTSYGLPFDQDEFNSLLPADVLIELIVETIEPDSWNEVGEVKDLNLVFGSGQMIVSEGGIAK